MKLPRSLHSSFRRRIGEKVGHQLLFKDAVFTPEDWAYQKTWKRYLPTPWLSLRVLWGFSWVVVFITLFSVCVCLYHSWLENVGAPAFWDKSGNLWQPFSLTSFALALLMVHRTTASYNRWWEARIAWGQMLNITRNIVREAAVWFSEEDRMLLEMLSRWVICMPLLLRAHLLRTSVQQALCRVLPQDQLEFLLEAVHPPNRCAQVVSSIIARALSGAEHQQARVWLDEQVLGYVNTVGACERIIKTPIPHCFTRHLARFLLVWLGFLPFALWPVFGWATPGIIAAVSFLLIGVENIGIQIEEPFAVLALEAFCAGCEANVLEMMDTYQDANQLVDSVRMAGMPGVPGYEREAAVEKQANGHKRADAGALSSSGVPYDGQRAARLRETLVEITDT